MSKQSLERLLAEIEARRELASHEVLVWRDTWIAAPLDALDRIAETAAGGGR